MKRSFTVQTTIARSAEDVFNAIADPEILAKFFVDKSSGRLAHGSRIVWNWGAWGDYPVEIDTVVPHSQITLRINSKDWRKSSESDYDVQVDFELEELESNLTLLKISESGWHDDPEGIKASYENCGGWQHMADCAKAWLEHGIDLRARHVPAQRA